MLMAALDGIENKIDPGKPLDENIYELPVKEKARIKKVPGTLTESLISLQRDHTFLTKGGVFTEDVITTYIDYKMKNEILELSLRPHPFEFALYYDN